MSEQENIERQLSEHKAALNTYREWDQRVKELLKGRRNKGLTEEDMVQYRDAAAKRDAAFDKMRRFERALLDDIPGASTGPLTPIPPENPEGN